MEMDTNLTFCLQLYTILAMSWLYLLDVDHGRKLG